MTSSGNVNERWNQLYNFTFSAHNFDVDIDLNVASPNNATNVNLKPVVRLEIRHKVRSV